MQDKMEAAEMKPTPLKERIKRTETVQHEISLRKRKSPSRSSHKLSSMLEEGLKDIPDIPSIPENTDNANNQNNPTSNLDLPDNQTNQVNPINSINRDDRANRDDFDC